MQLFHSLFTHSSPGTSQALSAPHFAPLNPLTQGTSSPTCYHILTSPETDVDTSILLVKVPIDRENIQKVKFFSSWNICTTLDKSLTSLLAPNSFSRISLPNNCDQAQLILTKEILGKDLNMNLLR